MKKLTSTLGVFALAIGAVAAMAMSPAPTKAEAKSSTTDPYWFRLSDGTYIDQKSIPDQQNDCGEELVPCVRGYVEYDFENDEPLSSPIDLDGKEQM